MATMAIICNLIIRGYGKLVQSTSTVRTFFYSVSFIRGKPIIFEKSSVVASITASVFVDPSRVPSDHGKIDEKINDVV